MPGGRKKNNKYLFVDCYADVRAGQLLHKKIGFGIYPTSNVMWISLNIMAIHNNAQILMYIA